MNDFLVTPAYALFQELGHLSLLMFSDVVDVKRRGLLEGACPYSVQDDEVGAFMDPSRHTCITRLASSPRFPWQLTNIRGGLRRAELWLHADPVERLSSRSGDQYSSTRALVQQALILARKMVLVSPRYGELAFGLSALEISDLADAADAGMVEASAHIRLVFRTQAYRDVLRTYAAISGQPAKDSQGLLGQIARMSGLSAPKIS